MTGPDPIGARFEVDCAAIGFAPPPAPLRARLVKGEEVWSLHIAPAAGAHAGAVLDWLAPAGLRRLELAPQGAMRADFATLPPAWAEAFHGVEVESLRLAPDGKAEVSIVGTRAAVQRFAARVLEHKGAVEVTGVHPASEPRKLLTDPQEEALREAVVSGYYRIPRPLNLHELAERMGITAASLSERLRRAEARVLTKFVEDGEVPPSRDSAPPGFEGLMDAGARRPHERG